MDDYIWKENLSTARSSLNRIWRWPASKAVGLSQQTFIVLLRGGSLRSDDGGQFRFHAAFPPIISALKLPHPESHLPL